MKFLIGLGIVITTPGTAARIVINVANRRYFCAFVGKELLQEELNAVQSLLLHYAGLLLGLKSTTKVIVIICHLDRC